MKISEILVEAPNDATAKMKQFVQQNKAELNKGQNDAPPGGALVGKIAPGTLARDKNVAAQRDPGRQAGSYTQKTTTPTVQTPPVAKPAAAPAPRGGGADRMPVAKPAAAPAKVSAPARPASADALAQKAGANIGLASTVSGSATNQAAQDKFNQRQPQAVAKKAKQPTKTVGAGGMSDDDRK